MWQIILVLMSIGSQEIEPMMSKLLHVSERHLIAAPNSMPA